MCKSVCVNVHDVKSGPVRCGCGGEAEIGQKYLMGNLPDVYVICGNCSIRTGEYYTETEAIEAWNKAMGERTAMVCKPAEGRPAYEKGICSCGYVLSVLQRDFVYCPSCGARLEWE